MDMFKFKYYIYFDQENRDLIINILLRLEDDTLSVYYRRYDEAILKKKEYFQIAYNEFKEYLQNTHIVMKKEHLLFLNQQLVKHELEYPKVYSVTVEDFKFNPDDYVNELTSKEILFLMFINGKRVNDQRIESWEKEYHLNVAYLTQSLLDAGYITKNDYRRNMQKAKRSQLREVMDTYGLDGIGDNEELIKIITENLTEEQLASHFSGTHYFLTSKGERVVANNRKLDDFSRSYYRHVENMRLEEFHLLSLKRPNYNFQAICRLLIQNNESSQKEYVDWEKLVEDVIHNRLPKPNEMEKETKPKKMVEVFIDNYSNKQASMATNHRSVEAAKPSTPQPPQMTERKTPKPIAGTDHHATPIIDLTEEVIGYVGPEKIKRQIENYERRKAQYMANDPEALEDPTRSPQGDKDQEASNTEGQGRRSLPFALQLLFHCIAFMALTLIILVLIHHLNISKINHVIDNWVEALKKFF